MNEYDVGSIVDAGIERIDDEILRTIFRGEIRAVRLGKESLSGRFPEVNNESTRCRIRNVIRGFTNIANDEIELAVKINVRQSDGKSADQPRVVLNGWSKISIAATPAGP